MQGVEQDARNDQEGSPQKRGRMQDQPFTLAMLKEVLAQERHVDREHLAQSIEQVQGDVRAMRGRVDSVEQGVTTQMQKTMQMLNKITDNYDAQAKALESLEELKGSSEGVRAKADNSGVQTSRGLSAGEHSRYGRGRPAASPHHRRVEPGPGCRRDSPSGQGYPPSPRRVPECRRPLRAGLAPGVCNPAHQG